MSRRSEEGKTLPRIQSQKKMENIGDKPETRQALRSRPISNNTIKRTISSANVSKGHRIESGKQNYKLKIEELEQHNLYLDKQIQEAEKQIQMFRTISMNQKRNYDDSQSVDRMSRPGTARKNINYNDPNSIKKEIRLVQNKVIFMRKRIDEQNQKNSKIRTDIDAARKQIQTLKNLSKKTEESLHKTRKELIDLQNLSQTLDEQISEKNEQMRKNKVDSIRRQTENIKKYDKIIKEIEKELGQTNEEVEQEENEKGFYMTEVATINKQKMNLSSLTPKKRYKQSISTLRDKIIECEREFDVVKENMGAKNTQQITQKFQETYEKNFTHYQFINEIFRNLQQAKEEQNKLMERKKQIISELDQHVSGTKLEYLTELEQEFHQTASAKKEIQQKSKHFQQIFSHMKEIVEQSRRMVMKNQSREEVTQKNMCEFLQGIKQRSKELEIYEGQQVHIKSHSNYISLDEMLESVKRQGHEGKKQKLMTKQQMMESQKIMAHRKIKEIRRKKK